MPPQPSPPCDVVDCLHRATGTYLDMSLAEAVEFAVCDTHYAWLKNGQRPTVLPERLEPAELAEPRALLFPAGTADD